MSGDADRTVVVRGAMRTIEYAVCSNASMPAREFIEDELSQAERIMDAHLQREARKKEERTK